MSRHTKNIKFIKYMSAAWLIIITQIKKKPQNEKSVKTLKPEKETKIRDLEPEQARRTI